MASNPKQVLSFSLKRTQECFNRMFYFFIRMCDNQKYLHAHCRKYVAFKVKIQNSMIDYFDELCKLSSCRYSFIFVVCKLFTCTHLMMFPSGITEQQSSVYTWWAALIYSWLIFNTFQSFCRYVSCMRITTL